MVPIYPNNEEFDPEKHEAVSMEQNKDKEDEQSNCYTWTTLEKYPENKKYTKNQF